MKREKSWHYHLLVVNNYSNLMRHRKCDLMIKSKSNTSKWHFYQNLER